MSDPLPEDLLALEDVPALLRLRASRQDVRGWVDRGLPIWEVGPVVTTSREAVHAFLSGRCSLGPHRTRLGGEGGP